MSNLSPNAVCALAVAASCSPRTVQSYLNGGNVRPSIRERIAKALEASGRSDLLRVEPSRAHALQGEGEGPVAA